MQQQQQQYQMQQLQQQQQHQQYSNNSNSNGINMQPPRSPRSSSPRGSGTMLQENAVEVKSTRRLSIDETNALARRLSQSKVHDEVVILFEGRAYKLFQCCRSTEYRMTSKYVEVDDKHLCCGRDMETVALADVFHLEMHMTCCLRRCRIILQSNRRPADGSQSGSEKHKLTVHDGEEIFNRLCSAIAILRFPADTEQVVLYDGPAAGCCTFGKWYRVTTQFITIRRGLVYKTMEFLLLYDVVRVDMHDRFCACSAKLILTLCLPSGKLQTFRLKLDSHVAKALYRKLNSVVSANCQRRPGGVPPLTPQQQQYQQQLSQQGSPPAPNKK